MIFRKLKNKYLIAVDLDGTLLNERKRISFKTKRLLMKLDARGHMIVLASGRPVRAVQRYYDELKLHSPMICYNGSWIGHPHDSTFKTTAFSFPKEVVISIFEKVGPKHIDNIMCETNKDIWLLQQDTDLAAFFWHDKMNIIYGDLRKTLTQNPMTMIIKSAVRGENADQLLYDAVKEHDHLKIRFWSDSVFSEIYYEDVSKGHAVETIAKQYGFSLENTIAFGDAENDLEMLSMSGMGIAMKNATETVKRHADLVTEKDNNHDGIYFTLKKILK